MKKLVVFISNGSVTDPIVHSQGLPILQNYEDKSIFISFETQSKEEFNSYYSASLKEKYNNVRFYPIFLKGFLPLGIENLILGIFNIVLLQVKNRISIIHARSLMPAIIGLIAKSLFLGKILLIYDNRGVLIEEEIFKGKWNRNSKMVKILFGVEKLLIKYSDHIVVVSNVFKQYLLRMYNFVNLDSKISVIPNGTKINCSENKEKKRFNKNLTCVYSGSSAPWQKIDSVFDIFVIIKELFQEIDFKIITYQKNEFEKKLNDFLFLKPNIEILSLPSSKVKAELEKCSFGVLIRDNNLINNVSSPLKFAEYLAAGLPILISEKIGDTEEIIKKYKVGVIIKDNNYKNAVLELIELLKDDRVVERCKMVAQKVFNLNDAIKKYIQIYEKLHLN